MCAMRHIKRIEPGPGQESVWDYPRPPCLEPTRRHIQIVFNGTMIADTRRALRVLETSHPPTYYIPPTDVRLEYLLAAQETSVCEWKGHAQYFTLCVDGRTVERAAWSYPTPPPSFAALCNHLAFYAHKMDLCLVDDQKARAQPGNFYGGWITEDVVGPFKGEPGTWWW